MGKADGEHGIAQDSGDEPANALGTNQDVDKPDAGVFATPVPLTGERQTTTRIELWTWYLYYVGCSGLGPFNFAISAWQNLLYLAGYDPAFPAGTVPCGDGGCVLGAYGQIRSINSIVLISNGLSFALQAVLFLLVGSYADYGSFRPWITIVFTALAIGTSFGWLGVESAEKWQIGTGLYIVGLIAYQGSLTFWTAAFVGLARDLPEAQQQEDLVRANYMTPAEFDLADSMRRNRLSNVSFFVCSCGELIVLGILAGILVGIDANNNNTKALSIVCAYSAGVWILCAAPWFWFEQYRPGYRLPPGTSYLLVGFKQLYHCFKLCLRLKQTFIYLAGYFLLGDCLNTTVTVIATLQNEVVSYNTELLNYLLIDGIAAQAVGIGLFWLVQKRFKIATKTMLLVVAFGILVLCAWGCVGITQTFGFHSTYEFWLYQAFYGVAVCPWYAYSQTMISEVSPPGKSFLFFAVFSVIGKTSSFIGPFVSSAIITRAEASGKFPHPNNVPFIFLLALGIVSTVIIWAVDVSKSRIECRRYLEEEAIRVYNVGSSELLVSDEQLRATMDGARGEGDYDNVDLKGKY